MAEKIDITGLKIPQHVAIILDGNGRWARSVFFQEMQDMQQGLKMWKR